MESTPQQRLSHALSCPSCGSRLCIRVDQQGWADTLYQWVGKFPWFCRHCGTRFYLNTASVSLRSKPPAMGRAPETKGTK